jgi:hypothetical protein
MFGILPEYVKECPWLIDSALFWFPDSLYDTHLRVCFLNPSSRRKIAFTVEGEIPKCFVITVPLAKGDLSRHFLRTGLKIVRRLYGRDSSRHDNRRSWTFEATVSLSPWTRQGLGRYGLVLLWSFSFPILSGGGTWQWLSARIRPWRPINVRSANIQKIPNYFIAKAKKLFIIEVIWCPSCTVSGDIKFYSLLLIFIEMGWAYYFLHPLYVQNYDTETVLGNSLMQTLIVADDKVFGGPSTMYWTTASGCIPDLYRGPTVPKWPRRSFASPCV